jgi:predicted transcriptional regulator
MTTITIEISDELAERLQPYQTKIEQVLEIGLQQISITEESQHTELRERMLAALRETGLIQPLDKNIAKKYQVDELATPRQPPLVIQGKPVSSLIIEQRGPQV